MPPVQPNFPHPTRMIYEALRRLQAQRPSAQELFQEIHRLYPSVPRARNDRITPPRVLNGITIPTPLREAPYPDHPINSLETLTRRFIPYIEKRKLIQVVYDRPKRRHGYRFNTDFPHPLPPSTTVPSFSAAAAQHQIPGEAILSPPSSSSPASGDTAAATEASNPIIDTFTRPLDVDGLPSMPERWDALRSKLVGLSQYEQLAHFVGQYQQIERLRPHARAVVKSYPLRDRGTILATYTEEELSEMPILPKRKRDPSPDNRPIRSERDQLIWELKLFSDLNRRRQRRRVEKELSHRRWKEAIELKWAVGGSELIREVQAIMDFRREKEAREWEAKASARDEAAREQNQAEADRLAGEATRQEAARAAFDEQLEIERDTREQRRLLWLEAKERKEQELQDRKEAARAIKKVVRQVLVDA